MHEPSPHADNKDASLPTGGLKAEVFKDLCAVRNRIYEILTMNEKDPPPPSAVGRSRDSTKAELGFHYLVSHLESGILTTGELLDCGLPRELTHSLIELAGCGHNFNAGVVNMRKTLVELVHFVGPVDVREDEQNSC